MDSGKIQIVGKGDKKGTFTHPDDIVGFTAYVITHLSPSELDYKVFRIQGESATLLDVAGYYGSKYPVEHVEKLAGDGLESHLQQLLDTGRGSVAYDISTGKELTGADAAGASNALWVGHQWKNIKQGLGL